MARERRSGVIASADPSFTAFDNQGKKQLLLHFLEIIGCWLENDGEGQEV